MNKHGVLRRYTYFQDYIVAWHCELRLWNTLPNNGDGVFFLPFTKIIGMPCLIQMPSLSQVSDPTNRLQVYEALKAATKEHGQCYDRCVFCYASPHVLQFRHSGAVRKCASGNAQRLPSVNN